jgi:hypothetical protein
MNCPECGAEMREREDHFPDCEDCGFTQYDEETLALQREVQREQAEIKEILGYVPTYHEAAKKGLIKP